MGSTHTVNRVLDLHPCVGLADHLARGGGKGLQQARAIGAVRTIDVVERSGLRGRGGAGFPTGVKWRTVARAGRRLGPRRSSSTAPRANRDRSRTASCCGATRTGSSKAR